MGQPIAELGYGCFSDWGLVSAKAAIPVPKPAPEIVALLTSGLTASVGESLLVCHMPSCVCSDHTV